MKIEISEFLLRNYSVDEILSSCNLDDEIEYHVHNYNQKPKRISIIHLLEDNDNKYKYTKNHMVLHPIEIKKKERA